MVSHTPVLTAAQNSFFGSGNMKKLSCSWKWIRMMPAIAIPRRMSATSILLFGLSEALYVYFMMVLCGYGGKNSHTFPKL